MLSATAVTMISLRVPSLRSLHLRWAAMTSSVTWLGAVIACTLHRWADPTAPSVRIGIAVPTKLVRLSLSCRRAATTGSRRGAGTSCPRWRSGVESAVHSIGFMLDPLTFLPLPTLRGERVILRGPRDSDVDDRLRHPIDPEEEDGYGSSWRREWDGRRYHTRDHLMVPQQPPEPGAYTWAVEYDGRCVGSAGLPVDPDQHCATYTVGLFVAALRGRGLGREVTRLVLAWAFDVLGVHRVQLEVLAG